MHAAQAQEFPGTFEGFLQTIRVREKVDEFEKNYTGLLDIVVDNPKALYKFFQRYNYLNAQIASSIAGLVGNIGMSREIFIDINAPVRDEADYSFDVADWVLKAAID